MAKILHDFKVQFADGLVVDLPSLTLQMLYLAMDATTEEKFNVLINSLIVSLILLCVIMHLQCRLELYCKQCKPNCPQGDCHCCRPFIDYLCMHYLGGDRVHEWAM